MQVTPRLISENELDLVWQKNKNNNCGLVTGRLYRCKRIECQSSSQVYRSRNKYWYIWFQVYYFYRMFKALAKNRPTYTIFKKIKTTHVLTLYISSSQMFSKFLSSRENEKILTYSIFTYTQVFLTSDYYGLIRLPKWKR